MPTDGQERTTDHLGARAPVRAEARVDPRMLPDWLRPLEAGLGQVRAEDISRFTPPPGTPGRQGAVLALFGEGPAGPDLLFIERAHTMRSHAGQPAFPGGSVDEGDPSIAATALREATEEVGLDPGGVTVFGTLPPLYLPPSAFTVTTVLGWWHTPCAVHAADADEVASVVRVPIADLADPANRCRVRLLGDYTGPGFRVGGLLVWGFTAGLVDALLRFGGWALPWEPADVVDRPEPRLAAGHAPYDPADVPSGEDGGEQQ
ncbi:MAG TPA: CoA pyrophosphatase [Mycobacteriales bacterium]|nr:CoA pyrophosphatase [Mycobacteriales bacterium]